MSPRKLSLGGRGCIFQVAATDGFHTVTADSDPIDLPEIGPRPRITWSPDGQRIVVGDHVMFRAQLVGFIGDDITVVSSRWASDRDGELAQTPMFETSKLSAGAHLITLTAVDSRGHEVSAAITVHVAGSKG